MRIQPFGDNHTNPSYLIAACLPTKQTGPSHPPIKIHTHPSPITVAYRSIRDTIPNLLFPNSPQDVHPNPNYFYKQSDNAHLQADPAAAQPIFDIVLHIGMAPGRDFYALETWAHRDGYKREDVNGETLDGDTFWKRKYGAPAMLQTGFDSEDVLRRWKLELAVCKNPTSLALEWMAA
jgi:pyrrolidone-carboxylate peptidase